MSKKVSVCDNCGKMFPPGWGQDLNKIPDILTRLTPGGQVPTGECTECNALTYYKNLDSLTAQEAAREQHRIDADDFQELEESEAQLDDDCEGGFWVNIRVFVPMEDTDLVKRTTE